VLTQVIQEQRKKYNKDEESFNLLYMLFGNEHYANDLALLDECMNTFFAATQTSATSLANLLLNTIYEEEVLRKLRTAFE
jgi:cytochrome P450